ncbi:MAG: glycine cleavage T C-terminal barrel domain-containing protein [Planctomycetota bacterium]
MGTQKLREMLDALGALRRPEDSVPVHFGDPAAEYEAANEIVGLTDISSRGRLEITGKDRVRLVNNLCTNDIPKTEPGSGREAFFLDAKGRIIDYAVVFVLADSLWLDLAPGRAGSLIKHLDRYIIREDVQLHDRSLNTASFHLIGPKAEEVLQRVNIALGTNLQHAAAVIGGATCHAFRRDRSVQPGYDIVVDLEDAPTVWSILWDAGQIAGIRPVGSQVMEVLRVEAGIPEMGKEVTDANFPQEFGRDPQAISFTKGCYIGQETVARIDAYGHVNRQLRGLIWHGPADPLVGHKVYFGDKEMGSVASAVASPKTGNSLGLAVLRTGGNEPGAEVVVKAAADEVRATVASLPFSSPSLA